MHSLLRRQLKRRFGGDVPDAALWRQFLSDVSDVYYDFDVQRELIERSLVLSSEELHQANAQMRAIFQAIPDLLLRLNAKGVILDFQSGASDEPLKPGRAWVGQAVQTLAPAPLGAQAGEALRRVIETKSPLAIEYSLTHPSGENLYEARLVPLPKDEIFAIVRNVTARKRAEDELRRNEERFRSLIENASDMITVINESGTIRFQSPSSERVFGFPAADMAGRSIFDFIHREDSARFRDTLRRILQAAAPVAAQFRMKHRDGGWRVISSMARNVPGEAPDGYVIINSRDITENIKLEEHLLQAQKMEALGQLSGGIAHDFNNILTIIRGHVSLMEFNPAITPQLGDSIAEIRLASERAANLTRQLLAFSRRQRMHAATIDLNEVVSNMTRMLQRILGEDVSMFIHCAPRPAMVHADLGMIEQILLNLAVNSRDAMPRGGRLVIQTANVQISPEAAAQSPSARAGVFVCLSVSDTGSGIPPDVLPRIFEPFFTTKDVGKGTGLGLATVYGVVEQHHGWINVHSEPGRGTTFRIYLPRSEKEDAIESPIPTMPSVRGGNETILLVEDEPAVRALVRSILTRAGYHVLEAPNGAHALDLWRQHHDRIKLLLTDMIMPGGMNGRELAQQFAQEKPGLKVIYASGYSANAAGGDLIEGTNFLAKPFNPLKLAQVVRSRLDENGK
ncbi:MAG: PAS domain S-box protein [Verrucomicrobiota bacterium]|nr:PAS domain S-box protein [Verrucomicrobiota bacterium]